jgi:hypothetical protein
VRYFWGSGKRDNGALCGRIHADGEGYAFGLTGSQIFAAAKRSLTPSPGYTEPTTWVSVQQRRAEERAAEERAAGGAAAAANVGALEDALAAAKAEVEKLKVALAAAQAAARGAEAAARGADEARNCAASANREVSALLFQLQQAEGALAALGLFRQ